MATHLKRGWKAQWDGTEQVSVQMQEQKALQGAESWRGNTALMEDIVLQFQIQQVSKT